MRWLLVPLAAAAFLLAAPTAQAFTCGPAPPITASGDFDDCSGTQNFVTIANGRVEHDGQLDGEFAQDDWFTDLHITFTDSGVTVDTVNSFLFNNTDNVAWTVSSSAANQISFIAPNNDARVDGDDGVTGGDDYDWRVFLNGISGLNELNFTIEYTMDVPEPGALALLAAAFLPLGGILRRRRTI